MVHLLSYAWRIWGKWLDPPILALHNSIVYYWLPMTNNPCPPARSSYSRFPKRSSRRTVSISSENLEMKSSLLYEISRIPFNGSGQLLEFQFHTTARYIPSGILLKQGIGWNPNISCACERLARHLSRSLPVGAIDGSNFRTSRRWHGTASFQPFDLGRRF